MKDIHSRNDLILEVILLGLILIWAIYILIKSYNFEPIFAWLFPTIVAVPLVLLIVIELISQPYERIDSILTRIKIDTTLNIDGVSHRAEPRNVAIFVLTTVGYAIIATFIGFFYAMPIFLIAYLYLLNCYSFRKSILISILVWFCVSFLFGTFFDVPGVDFGPFSNIDLGIFD